MRKMIALVLVIALCGSLLAGCCLRHEWRDATCEDPRLCVECGKTKGEPLGHDWQDAACELPKTCKVCDETEGEPLGHTWENDVCSVCNQKKDDIFCRDSYTGTDVELIQNVNTVVVEMGGIELTNRELQLHYLNCLNSFYSQNYYYFAMLGIDTTLPIHEQTSFYDENMTWEQFFLNRALEAWQAYTTLEIMASEDNFEGTDEVLEKNAQVEEQTAYLAEIYGYEDEEAFLESVAGPGMDMDSYMRYNTDFLMSQAYIDYFYQANEPDSAQIEAYAQDNAETLLAEGISEDMGMMGSVRHILVVPEGDQTEAQWEAAEAEAERILQLWKDGTATEDSFAELVPTYFDDGGSLQTGGLYENVCDDGTYVPEFTAWAVDPVRQVGDTGIVKTSYGYHIMYYVQGEAYFPHAVKQIMLAELFRERQAQVLAENPPEVYFRKIVLQETSFGG